MSLLDLQDIEAEETVNNAGPHSGASKGCFNGGGGGGGHRHISSLSLTLC
jgi:hypothetical protein